MPKIKNLAISAFRGIVDEELPFEGRSVVLLGENGMGKSSFVDALDFLFSGKVSHLEGAHGISTAQHGPHIRLSTKDASVVVEFDKPAVRLARTFNGLGVIPEELAPFMEMAAESTFMLRRKNILDFILAQPAPRYQQLAAIIGVDDLDKAERVLMQARDELEAERDEAVRQERAASFALRQTLGETALTDDAILMQLNNKLQELGQAPLVTLADIETRKVEAVAQSRSPENTKRFSDIKDLLSPILDLRDVSLAPTNYQEHVVRVEDLRADGEQRKQMLFTRLLTLSRGLIADLDIDYCPVCLQPIGKEELLASLDWRVRQTEELAQKASEISRAGTAMASATRQLVQNVQDIHRRAAALRLATDLAPLLQVIAMLERLIGGLKADPWDAVLVPINEIDTSPAGNRFHKCLDALCEELQSEQGRIEQTDQDQLVVAVIDLLTKTDQDRTRLKQVQAQGHVKSAAYREMSAVYDCFVATKQREVQAIYSELESDIQRYYQSLHAEEGYRSVKIEINEGRRASTDIRMNFYDRDDEDPRGFSSEGHLDSLGLCIFLAFVKRFNAGFPLMVLDDVVSSIDSRHRRHICDLLSEEFADYQLFITTHDYVWFEELCAHQRAMRVGHKFTNLQIVDWTLEDGPRLNKYRSRWDLIEDKLKSGDRDGAAADTRKELEIFLYELCINTQTSVVLRRDRRYGVDDLMGPLVKRMKDLVPDVYQNNLAVFQALDEDGIFGNMMVHNNPMAGNVSLTEVCAFAEALKDFESLLTCEKGHLVEYHRTARVLKCRCGAINWATRG